MLLDPKMAGFCDGSPAVEDQERQDVPLFVSGPVVGSRRSVHISTNALPRKVPERPDAGHR
jgi:hypothetical protein